MSCEDGRKEWYCIIGQLVKTLMKLSSLRLLLHYLHSFISLFFTQSSQPMMVLHPLQTSWKLLVLQSGHMGLIYSSD